MKRLATGLLLLALCRQGFGWGHEGHRIVADIAEARLSDPARSNLHALIGDQKLASIANWADDILHPRFTPSSLL
jgi:hypothetical protein